MMCGTSCKWALTLIWNSVNRRYGAKSRAHFAAAMVLLSLVPTQGGAQTSPGTGVPQRSLVVTGSSTVSPLMTDIARRFEGMHRGVSIEVRAVGSARGIADLRAGAAHIAMVARQLVDSERELFAFPLCRDGAAIVVHRANPVTGLSSHQLAEMVTGRISDWKQLGAPAGAIRLAWRTEGQAIPDLVLQQLKLKPEQIRSHTTIFENTDAVAFVANDRNAITLAALGVAERSLKSGAPIKLLAYQGIPASTRAVRDHTYLLSRPLLLVTRSTPTGLQKQLVDYAASAAVIDLKEKHGFVPYQE